MQVINDEDIDMNVSVDWKTAVKNPYLNKFSREEKLKAMLDCFIAVEKIDKKELKKELDIVLS